MVPEHYVKIHKKKRGSKAKLPKYLPCFARILGILKLQGGQLPPCLVRLCKDDITFLLVFQKSVTVAVTVDRYRNFALKIKSPFTMLMVLYFISHTGANYSMGKMETIHTYPIDFESKC